MTSWYSKPSSWVQLPFCTPAQMLSGNTRSWLPMVFGKDLLFRCQIHKIIILQIIQFKTPIYVKFSLVFPGMGTQIYLCIQWGLCFLHISDAFLPFCPLLCCLMSLPFPLIFSFYEIFLHVSLSKGAEPHSVHSKDFTLQASAQQLDNDADLPALRDELPEAWEDGMHIWFCRVFLLACGAK